MVRLLQISTAVFTAPIVKSMCRLASRNDWKYSVR